MTDELIEFNKRFQRADDKHAHQQIRVAEAKAEWDKECALCSHYYAQLLQARYDQNKPLRDTLY